jgi:hypothetical protein
MDDVMKDLAAMLDKVKRECANLPQDQLVEKAERDTIYGLFAKRELDIRAEVSNA